MWSKLLISVVVLPTIILACRTTTPSYQANVTNRSDGAIVRGWVSGKFMFFTHTEIEKVDGLPLSVWSQVGGGCPLKPCNEGGFKCLNT